MTKTLKSTWVARCGDCRGHRRLTAGTTVEMWNSKPLVRCCGSQMTCKRLKGSVSDHECGSRCLSSKGHVCECSCGGVNHGSAA
jgi:hypothetical protein